MSTKKVTEQTTHSSSDMHGLDELFDVLTLGTAEAGIPVPRSYLIGPSDHELVELPGDVYEVLVRVVDAMRNGLSVTVSPTSQTLTTQQAADLLGISRPTLIKALDEGKLAYHRVGKHRRLALPDVLEYRERRRSQQHAAIDALGADVDESVDIGEQLDALKRARKAVAAKRRTASAG